MKKLLVLTMVVLGYTSVPAYSACTLPGDTNADGVVTIAEVQATINAFLGLTACQSTPTYSMTDLAGTWRSVTITAGGGADTWAHSTFIVAQDGSFTTSNYLDSQNGTSNPTGTFAIDSTGKVTNTSNSFSNGMLNRSKNIVIGNTSGSSSATATPYKMNVFIKDGATFNATDFANTTWNVQLFSVGGTTPGWQQGTATIGAGSTISFNLVKNTGVVNSLGPISLTIAQTGEILAGTIPTLYGISNSTKDFVVFTLTDNGGSKNLVLMSKTGGAAVSLANIAGYWREFELSAGSNYMWERALLNIDAAGTAAITSKYTNGTAQSNSTKSMSVSGGLFTSATASTYKGFLSYDGDLIIGTLTSPSDSNLLYLNILVR